MKLRTIKEKEAAKAKAVLRLYKSAYESWTAYHAAKVKAEATVKAAWKVYEAAAEKALETYEAAHKAYPNSRKSAKSLNH